MKKYEVNVEHFEVRKGSKDWSVKDMMHAVYLANCRNPETIIETESLEEAKKIFESRKNDCCSEYVRGNAWMLVEFDYISIELNDYDEDGDFIQSIEITDDYIPEVK